MDSSKCGETAAYCICNKDKDHVEKGDPVVGSAPLVSPNIDVTVFQFGAVGDGITDDTEAIQAAIDFVVHPFNASVISEET